MVKNWDSAKSTIYHLYVSQGQNLEEVKEAMKKHHNFSASKRAYKLKIREWGWRTNRDVNGQIATVRRRRRRRIVATGTQGSISHVGGASVVTAEDVDFRTVNSGTSSGQPISPGLSNVWTMPGSFNLSAVGQDFSPRTPQVDHAFELPPQDTPMNFEPDVVNQQDTSGNTLLHRMVAIGELDDVRNLLSRGARFDIQNNESNQPLHLAVIGKYPHIIKYLLKSGAKVNAKGSNGRTPVHFALGFPEALRALLGAHPNLSIPDNDGDTALHAALRESPMKMSRKDGIIEKLLHRGANVNIMNHAGTTPFHMAMDKISYYPQYGYVPLFLRNGADITLKTNSGEWPFAVLLRNVWAYKHEWWGEILIFLQKGADPNTRVLGGDSLLYAMLHNWPTASGFTASGFVDVALQLCKTADVHTTSTEGDLPLHYVIERDFGHSGVQIERRLKIAKALLDRGSDPNQPNGKGERPLQILLSRSLHVPRIKIALTDLLDNRADPMLVDSSGDLPIYIAYRLFQNSDRDELVRILTDVMIARPETSNGSNDSQPWPAWWRKYRAFRLQHRWSDEGARLLERTSFNTASRMPQDVAENLPKLLLSFAAEEKLQAAKGIFKSMQGGDLYTSSFIQSEVSHVVRILRDCKALGIDIDVSWYHFLVDILP